MCVCDEHVCPLKCNSAFQNLLHKAHSKTTACPFKQTFNWVPTGQESFLKYITSLSLSLSRYLSLSLSLSLSLPLSPSGQNRGHLKVDPCPPSTPPLCPPLEQQGMGRHPFSVSSGDTSCCENDKCDIGRESVKAFIMRGNAHPSPLV